jgi:hypothetical protein
MTNKLTWQTVALLAIISAVALALATLAHWSSSDILAVVGVLAGLGGGAALGTAVAGGVSQRVDQLHTETAAQTPVLETIARRVNGELDGRIAAAQQEAAEQGAALAIRALREQGHIK